MSHRHDYHAAHATPASPSQSRRFRSGGFGGDDRAEYRRGLAREAKGMGVLPCRRLATAFRDAFPALDATTVPGCCVCAAGRNLDTGATADVLQMRKLSQQKMEQAMQAVIYAATRYGYSVRVVDGVGIDYEYSAGNHQLESQTITAPRSRNSVKLSQLRRWAKQTANEIAQKRGIPANRVEYDADLEATLNEWEREYDAERA